MSSFTDNYIADTYTGILHSETSLPTSGRSQIFDGVGNASSFSLGVVNQGATITGTLNASIVESPLINSNTINSLELISTSIESTSLKSGNVTYPSSLTDTTLVTLLYPIFINLIYPIGSIYLTVSDVNPSTIFSGTAWTQTAAGKFLVGAGSSPDKWGRPLPMTIGNNAGEYYHTFTLGELPAHSHTGISIVKGDGPGSGIPFSLQVGKSVLVHEDSGHTTNQVTAGQTGANDGELSINPTGGNGLAPITPPGFGMYVWQRVS
jgi:hypothetical protein